MSDERLNEKLRNILVLSQKGATEGERLAAKAALDRLMKKYKLTSADFETERKVIVRLNYSDKYQKSLALQIIGTVLETSQVSSWGADPRKEKPRISTKYFWISATPIQAAEILSMYSAYRKDLDEGLDRYVRAFFNANNIFPECAKSDDKLTEKELAEIKKMLSLANSIEPSVVRRLIQG